MKSVRVSHHVVYAVVFALNFIFLVIEVNVCNCLWRFLFCLCFAGFANVCLSIGQQFYDIFQLFVVIHEPMTGACSDGSCPVVQMMCVCVCVTSRRCVLGSLEFWRYCVSR